jgi:hypothetical protein
MLLRLHATEGAFGAGKLSESLNFSPRIIVCYEPVDGFGARARYWHYGALTESLGAGNDLRFEFDVLDLELYGRLRGQRTELILASGLRLAEISIDPQGSNFEGYGITLAADGRTRICAQGLNEWAWLYGARLSILGGDWEGGSLALHDDNILVQELYLGVGQRRRVGRVLIDIDLAVEVQNWHSDVLARDPAGNADTVSVYGPKLHLGASF